MLTMGARRSCAAAPPATTEAAVPHSKKTKSSTGAAPTGLSGSAADIAASATVAAPPLAATQVADAVGKREGKKKRTKQGSCTEQSSDELSSRAAGIRSDSGSTSERCDVQLGRKKMKQRPSACDQDDADHIILPVATAVPTSAAAASEYVATERQKKRRKEDSTAAVEACGVSSTSNNAGSSSEGTSSCRGSSSTSVCNSSTSACSDSSDSSDSSSTCCSSPPASSEKRPSAAAAKREKRRESVKEEESSCCESGKKEKEQVENEESCVLGLTPAASAAQGGQQQGSQLSAYKLTAQTLAVLQQRGIQQLLPIQAATFFSVYSGKDLIGRADTGTGKTLAFALPLVERLLSSSVSSSNRSTCSKNSTVSGGGNEARGVRLLVLLPTRELAQQVHAEFVLLLQGRMETACVYGGGGAAAAGRQQQNRWQSGKHSRPGGAMNGLLQQQQQLENLRRGRCGILIGCPGRVKDLINRGYLQRGAALQSVVLDEADRLLDMGFREDVEEILQWCRDAWKQADGALASPAAAAEQKNDERGERSTNVSVAAESGNSSKSSKDALQFLLFTATLPHWARSLASRFMRPDRLLVDAATLNNGSNANSAFNKTNEKTATTGGSSEQQQQQSGTNQGITYMVLFCPWKNRVRVLEDVLTVYAGCSDSRLPASTIPLSFSTLPSIGDSLDWAAAAAGESSAANAVTAGDGGDASAGGRRTGAAAVIFAETKQQVNEIALESGLRRFAAPLHGDLPQQQRETTLHAFKSGCFPYLVATDVAARGLHVDGLPLVVQLSPPRDLDSFVHRAGRTGRAGKAGICLTFAAAPDIPMLLTLEKKLRMQFKRVGVPQPAGIQRRLLELQLRWLLPATVATEESCNTSSRSSRIDISATSSCSSNDSSIKSNSERGRKRVRQGDCGDAQGSVERSDKKEYETKKDAGGKVERVAADKKKMVCTKGGQGKIKEEMRQIFDAADRVLHALSPREAVRRCLALLLRHAAAGTTCGTVFPQNEPLAGRACSASASAAAAAEGLQTVPPGMERLSCLNGREGLCTYVLRKREQQHERQQQHQQNGGGLLRTPGEVWRLLKGALLYQRRRISEGRGYSDRSSVPDQVVEELLERIQSLTLTADGRGAVFDVAAADIPAFEAHVLQRCGEQQPAEEDACCCLLTEAAGKRKRDRFAASDGERGRGKRGEEIERIDDAEEAATQEPEVPFVIRVAEELPELVDALALRRSERAQGSSRSSMHQETSSDFRSPWKHGRRENSERKRGGGYHHSNNGNNYRTRGSPGNRFRSENGYLSSNSERGMQQRSWISRGRGGGEGRGGGGGRVGINRGRRGFESNRGRGGYHYGGK